MNMIDLSFCVETSRIWQLIGRIINIMKVVVPIIIVLLATIDLGKAVMAGEEKEIKAAQKLVVKRLIYGVVIFFVTTVVQAVFGLVVTDLTENKNNEIEENACWTCVLSPEDDECKRYVNEAKAANNS